MNKTLAFVIPLKPKKNSKNWELDCKFLFRTLKSIINQTSNEWHAYVIGHDFPLNRISHSSIDYLRLPFEYLEFDQIEDRHEQMERNSYLKERDVEYIFDQGRKQMFGADLAKKKGYEYIMCLDGDDLIARQLVDFVRKEKELNQMGWFVDKGYFYVADRGVYIKQSSHMNMINGSSYIIHQSLIPNVNLFELTVNSNNFFSNHPYLRTRIKEYHDKNLRPLPFYATICLLTNLNWNTTFETIVPSGVLGRIKYISKIALNRKRIQNHFDVK